MSDIGLGETEGFSPFTGLEVFRVTTEESECIRVITFTSLLLGVAASQASTSAAVEAGIPM